MNTNIPPLDALVHAQAKHAKRLKKVERARGKLEKQRRKLAALEAEMARLASRIAERAEHAPGVPSAAQLRRACVIVNPHSKCLADGTYRLDDIVRGLQTCGIQAEVGLKTSGKVARQLARAAVARGDDLVIVAAGDGTIEDVAGELLESGTSLGILPMGTMNNLARSLGVPLDLRGACELLAARITRRIDIGRVITNAHPHGAYFLETAGVGLSALAAQLGQAAEKRRWGRLLGKLGALLPFKSTHVAIICDDGEVLRAETEVVTLSNAPLFGKQMLVAPEAHMDDGLLDLAWYPGMSTADLVRYFLTAANGKRVDEPRVSFRRVREVRIRTDAAMQANADLEVLAEQPSWEIAVVPQAISAVVGSGAALTLPVDRALAAMAQTASHPDASDTATPHISPQ